MIERRGSIQENAVCANLILRALGPEDRALIDPHLRRVALSKGDPLVRSGEPIAHVFFMEDGIGSITSSFDEAGRTEIGVIGREGMSGTSVLLGTDIAAAESFVQVDGRALRLPVDRLREAADRSASLRLLLLRYVEALMIQISHSVVSNAHHPIEARLARWLLMCHDRLGTDIIRLTHEFMAMMIAARRSGVTQTLHVLEGDGMIRARRGEVLILDRAKLAATAGEGYGATEAHYRRLIGPFGKGPDSACEQASARVPD